MSWKKLDIEQDPRKDHIALYQGMAYPYAGICANVDITGLLRGIKRENRPFFHTVLYAAAEAANRIPELRRRLRPDGIYELDYCRPSYTAALPDGSYCYCVLDGRMGYEPFLTYAREEQARQISSPSIADGDEAWTLLFVTSVPWISFTQVTHPVPYPADSNPRLSFGKYFAQGEQMLLPVSIQVHHALADGIHIAAFYRNFEENIRKLESGECIL